ncbi:phytoene/squalene synthase family protein [Luteimonas soli]|uniref:Phytoene/squalene synthase family protein n=1 Tax=Luteimonas soli TaxID=1648966 RepID=A0ABV7XID5_9GAMM
MSDADEFTAKWRARWPEWNIGGVFLSDARRETAFAWFALVEELTDAAWSGADATPGLAKLAWWNEELQGWAKGARRHPLGAVLQPQPAPWAPLAASLLSLQASRELPPGTDPEAAGVTSFARAAAGCERVLFDEAATEVHEGEGAGVVAFDLLAARQLLQGDAQDALQLLGVAPAGGRTTRPRRLHSALLRQRLRGLAANRQGQPPAAWRSLWLAWRAARGVG